MPYPGSSRFFSCVIVQESFAFTSQSVIHFELIFVKSIRSVSSFLFLFFLVCVCWIIPAPFVQKTVFAPLYCLCSFVKDQLTIFVWVFIWVLSCSIGLSCLYHTATLCCIFLCFFVLLFAFKLIVILWLYSASSVLSWLFSIFCICI